DAHTYISVIESEHAAGDPRRHWCFRARSVECVHAFHAAGIAAGGTDEGQPGLREHHHEKYFAAFLLDPEGNKLEAVFHGAPGPELSWSDGGRAVDKLSAPIA